MSAKKTGYSAVTLSWYADCNCSEDHFAGFWRPCKTSAYLWFNEDLQFYKKEWHGDSKVINFSCLPSVL